MEEVVLVTPDDEPIGTMEKMEAHRQGRLHRAFSIFIFNTQHELLIHQRAKEKYHSGELWTNTCCSHPRPGETVADAAGRRLREEMGISCKLTPAFNFTYKAALDHGLTEYELDHVFTGISDDLPHPDPAEVAAFRYVSLEALGDEIEANPDHFTAWFKIALPKVKAHLR